MPCVNIFITLKLDKVRKEERESGGKKRGKERGREGGREPRIAKQYWIVIVLCLIFLPSFSSFPPSLYLSSRLSSSLLFLVLAISKFVVKKQYGGDGIELALNVSNPAAVIQKLKSMSQ